MGQKGEGRQEYFYIDVVKLKGLMTREGMNESTLSEALEYSRGWFYQVKKRKQRVDLEDAQKIADTLGCKIQDFAASKGEGGLQYNNPVCIDYDAEAKERFARLLQQGKRRELADVLRFMEKDASNIDYLISLISPRVQIRRQKNISDSLSAEKSGSWIRMLYVSAFARALADELTVPDQDVADAFAMKRRQIEQASNLDALTKSRKKSEADRVKTREDIRKLEIALEVERSRIKREMTEAIKNIVKNKYMDRVDDIVSGEKFDETVLDECSAFLYRFFTNRVTDSSVDAQIGLYKKGELF